MIFNSLTFLSFLIIVVILYWSLPKKPRIWLIFLSSLTFYGFWRWEYLSLVLISTLVDYYISLSLVKIPKESVSKRKILLISSLIINIGLLIYFKYLFFFVDNLSGLAHLLNIPFHSPTFNIILPLGISFYTFQTISYTIDVYRGHTLPIRNFALYGSYVTFFPQLVAGPILRAEEVANQLKVRPKFDIEFVNEGIKRIFYGFFLKVVLADNIAGLVDSGFEIPASQMSGIDVWTLAFLFGFQIYFDFAGYSHIAIGCAKLMGINFPENFNFPYAAKSFKSFWTRWHISLSSWIRDYLYLPIMGVKVIDPNLKSEGGIKISSSQNISPRRRTFALFTTWAIMGFWHGANWTFVFWGIYHASCVYLERLIKPIREKFKFLSKPLIGWFITIPIAMLGWIPFRAQTMKDVFYMFSAIINPWCYQSYGMRENVYIITFSLFLLVSLTYLINNFIKPRLLKRPVLDFTLGIIQFVVVFILVFTFFRPISQFIYFQF